jgi:hypothetical protein
MIGDKLAALWVEVGTHDKTAAGMAGIRGKLAGWAGDMARTLTLPVTIAGAAALAGVTKYLYDATQKAANLAETMDKTRIVFEASAGSVIGFAEEMSDKFGVVRREVLDAASAFGLIIQGAGLSADASAKMSIQLVKLAADAGSLNNVALDVALEKIRAGLVGEMEPLRALGVTLDADAIKAKAAAMGFQEMTNAAKVIASSTLIMEGLSKATGNLEQTSGSLVNQQRKLAGDMEELQTSIGDELTPAMQSLIDLVYELGDALDGTFGGKRADNIKVLGAYIGGLVSGLSGGASAALTGVAGPGAGGWFEESAGRATSSLVRLNEWILSLGGNVENPLSRLFGRAAGEIEADTFAINFNRARALALAGQAAAKPPGQPKRPGQAAGVAGINSLGIPFGVGDEFEFGVELALMISSRQDAAGEGIGKKLKGARSKLADMEQSRTDRLAQGGVLGDQTSAVSSLQNELLNDLPRQQLEEQKKTVSTLERILEAIEAGDFGGGVGAGEMVLAGPE